MTMTFDAAPAHARPLVEATRVAHANPHVEATCVAHANPLVEETRVARPISHAGAP